MERGNRVFRVARKNIIFDDRLNEAWNKSSGGRLTVVEFLIQAAHFVTGLDMQLHDWNRNISEGEEEPVLAVLSNPQYIHEPPPLIPILPVSVQPLQPAFNEPPPLVYFQPLLSAANQPADIQLPGRTPSPPANSPLPPRFNFPAIPDEVRDLFAQLGDDPPTVRNIVHRKYENVQ